MSEWIVERIRRVTAFQAVGWALLTILCLLALWGGARTVRDFFGSPHEADAAYLAANVSTSGLPHSIVSVRGEQVQETGITQVRTSTRYGVETDRSTTRYWGLLVGDRWLVVESSERPGTKVVGELRHIGGDLRRELSDVAPDHRVNETFHPLYLATDGYMAPAWIILIFGLGGTLGIGWLTVRATRRFLDPSLHPVVRRAASWGPLADVSKHVLKDVESGERGTRGYVFGKRFIVQDRFGVFDLQRWDDLLWAYPGVVRRRLWFVIPVGSTWSAHLHFTTGSMQYFAKQSVVERTMEMATGRAPGAVTGFSEEIEAAFKKDRAGFRALVAERRAAASASAAKPAAK